MSFFHLKEKTTPKGKGEKSPKTPPTPKTPLTVPEIKAKLSETVKKVGVPWKLLTFKYLWMTPFCFDTDTDFSVFQGITLPKVQLKFENFVKNSYKVADSKVQYT